MEHPRPPSPLRTRLAWLALFWCAGVATLALAAWALRLLMRLIGLSA